MQQLQIIDKFDFKELKEDFRATMIAPSNSGKTEFLLFMLSKIVKWYKYIFLIVPCSNDKYAGVVWPNHVFLVDSIPQINEVLQTIIQFASKRTKLGKKRKMLVITDDLGLMTAHASCRIDTLLLRGRGIGISVVILAQSYQMISPNMRNNITHTFIFSVTDDFQHYLRNIPKSESSIAVMNRIKTLAAKLHNRSEPQDIKEGRKTRYVMVLSSQAGEMKTKYSFIEDYGQLFSINILDQQLSRMINNADIQDNQILA